MKWHKHEIGLLALAAILALCLGQAAWGGTYEYKIREHSSGSIIDSARLTWWTGADSSGTKRLTLSGDSTAIDSIADSIQISDTAAITLEYKFYFFGQAAPDDKDMTIPPMFPRVSGGAVDSNRTEQGGAGAGSFTVDWYVMDTLGGATTSVQGALVTVKNWALDPSPLRTVITTASGVGRIQLDADSIAAIATASLYNFPTIYDSIKYTTDTSDTIYGYLNVPAAAPGVANVRVYLDVGTGAVDSAAGTALPRTRVEYKLSLGGSSSDMNDGSWLFIPEDQVKRPDANGRVQFDVVATSSFLTGDPWYALNFRSLSRYSRWSGIVFKFEVDTLVDPISILDCEQVP